VSAVKNRFLCWKDFLQTVYWWKDISAKKLFSLLIYRHKSWLAFMRLAIVSGNTSE
jgi:hypothetical protein